MIPSIKKLCEISPFAAVVTANDGEIVFFNPAAEKLIGGLAEGRKFSEFVIGNNEPALEEMRLSLSEDEQLLTFNNAVLASVITRRVDEEMSVSYMRDISTQLKYVQKVSAQQKTEISLSRSSLIMQGKQEEALREIARMSAETMKISRVNIWKIDGTFSSITSLVNYDARSGGFHEQIALYRHQFPHYFAMMQEEEIIPTSDALTDKQTEEIRESYIKPFGITALLDVPVRIGGKMIGVICFEHTEGKRVWDVTEQNFALAIAQNVAQTLETNERLSAQRELEKALSEKKLLLAEVNQRVKNNFSLILDLLRLQENKVKDEAVQQLFAEIRSRITSMAMIHRQLYLADNFGAINFRDFLLDLASHFRSTFSAEGIEISTMLDNCNLPMGKALLGGLVVNELLTNFTRNTLSSRHHKSLSLKMTCFNEKVTLTFSADKGEDPELPEGLTKELVYELIGKLNGKLENRAGDTADMVLSFSMN